MRPWLRADDIPETAGDAATRAWAADAATHALWRLSGRRWSGAGQVAQVEIHWPRRRPTRYVSATYALGSVSPTVGQLATNGWEACEPTTVLLPDFPVTEIIEPSGCVLTDGVRVERAAGWADPTIITYLFGADPPADGVAAAVTLATELALGRSGDPSCRLPKRVTAITRQGVTMTMLDTLDLFDAGRTGVPEVDAWLGTVNPRRVTASPPYAWSPDLPYPRRQAPPFTLPQGASRLDLRATAGTALSTSVAYTQPDGSPVTGHTARAQLATLAGESLRDDVLPETSPGVWQWTLAGSVTASLPRVARYEVQAAVGAGDPTVLVAGLLITTGQTVDG